MLKISTKGNHDAVTLQLEGTLSGPSLTDFGRVWESARVQHYRKHLQIDLTRVSLVDQLGKELLALAAQYGTRLKAKGPMMAAVNEILSA